MADGSKISVHPYDWPLLQAASIGIILANAEGAIILANAEAEKQFGAGADGLSGRVVDSLLPGRLRERHARHRSAFIQDPTSRRMGGQLELVGVRGDGSEFPVEVGLTVVQIGTRPHILSFIVDMTARKQRETEMIRQAMEEHRSRLEECMSVLAGGLAHDFNNILMCILGNVDLMSMSLPAGSPAQENLEEIRTATNRGAEITKMMLTYSGKTPFVFQSVDLAPLIEEAAARAVLSIPHTARLVVEAGENVPSIYGDPSQLRQVVMHLISNAAEALDQGAGTIEIRSDMIMIDRDYLAQAYVGRDLPDGPAVCLEVSDTGCGMDAETRAQLFQPFRSTKFVGRGLGLAAVMGIVRGHHGAINVYSEPGMGTRVRIVFPPHGTVPDTRPRPDTRAWRFSGTALVVEDEQAILHVTRAILERAGFTVWTAEDGLEGVERVCAHARNIDVVILDMVTPRMNGFEAFYLLRQERPDLPVLFLSGFNHLRERVPLADGRTAFLQKPFETTDLLNALRNLLCPGDRAAGN